MMRWRTPSRCQGRLVLLRRARVLQEGAAQVADGRHAEAGHVLRRLHGVAHEVAVQRPGVQRAREAVLRQREVVQADHLVAGRTEAPEREAEQRGALDGPGQALRLERLLHRLEPGHVRVPEDRQAVGEQLRDALERGAEAGLGLLRQPVH
jgi:hypothetical protein